VLTLSSITPDRSPGPCDGSSSDRIGGPSSVKRKDADCFNNIRWYFNPPLPYWKFNLTEIGMYGDTVTTVYSGAHTLNGICFF
jgi:hypothetical protein